jgi:hypothetical protein
MTAKGVFRARRCCGSTQNRCCPTPMHHLRALLLSGAYLDPPRIDDDDSVVSLIETTSNGLFKVATSLHTHAGLLRLASSIFDLTHQGIVPARIVGNGRSRDNFLAVVQGQFQSCLTNVNPQSKSKFIGARTSRWFFHAGKCGSYVLK